MNGTNRSYRNRLNSILPTASQFAQLRQAYLAEPLASYLPPPARETSLGWLPFGRHLRGGLMHKRGYGSGYAAAKLPKESYGLNTGCSSPSGASEYRLPEKSVRDHDYRLPEDRT